MAALEAAVAIFPEGVRVEEWAIVSNVFIHKTCPDADARILKLISFSKLMFYGRCYKIFIFIKSFVIFSLLNNSYLF